MNYEEFVGNVTGFLQESLPCGTQLQRICVDKNNGVTMEGLSVRKKGQRIAPTIYLEAYYRDYLEGRSLPHIFERILECCEDCGELEDFDVDFFTDYRKVRSMIVYKLVNLEKNRELLSDVPYLPYLNLAIVFYCLLADRGLGQMTVLVRNSHVKLWGVGASQLYRDAVCNSLRLLPAVFLPMEEILAEEGAVEEEGLHAPMYVLTNRSRSLGAACLLYEDTLKRCSRQLGGDFYVLPSSVHEVILLPAVEELDEQELTEMVQEINATQVKDTEVLSDQIYLYSSREERLSLVGKDWKMNEF